MIVKNCKALPETGQIIGNKRKYLQESDFSFKNYNEYKISL